MSGDTFEPPLKNLPAGAREYALACVTNADVCRNPKARNCFKDSRPPGGFRLLRYGDR